MTMSGHSYSHGAVVGISNAATSGRRGDWGMKTAAVVRRRGATAWMCSGPGEVVVACTTTGIGNCPSRDN